MRGRECGSNNFLFLFQPVWYFSTRGFHCIVKIWKRKKHTAKPYHVEIPADFGATDQHLGSSRASQLAHCHEVLSVVCFFSRTHCSTWALSRGRSACHVEAHQTRSQCKSHPWGHLYGGRRVNWKFLWSAEEKFSCERGSCARVSVWKWHSDCNIVPWWLAGLLKFNRVQCFSCFHVNEDLRLFFLACCCVTNRWSGY